MKHHKAVVTVPDNLVIPTVCAKWGLKRLLVDVVWDAEGNYREKGGPGEFMREVFPSPPREGVSSAYPLTASSTRNRSVA